MKCCAAAAISSNASTRRVPCHVGSWRSVFIPMSPASRTASLISSNCIGTYSGSPACCIGPASRLRIGFAPRFRRLRRKGGSGGSRVALRSQRLVCREVELDGYAIRILDKNLVQAYHGHGALEIAHVIPTTTLEHARTTGDGQRNVVQRTGAPQLRIGVGATHIVDQRLRIVAVDTHHVDDAEIALGMIEGGWRIAVVEP